MTKNYRFYQLTYCSVCKLRYLTSNKGIVCSLTNDVAQFEKECPDYDFDDLELERIKKSIKEKIKKNYNSNKRLTSIFGYSYFIKKEEINCKNYYKDKKSTHNKFFEDTNDSFRIAISAGTLSFVFLFAFFNQKFNTTFFYLFIGTIAIGTLLYILETKREKKSLKTTENYLQFGSKIIYWREILDFGILRIYPNHKEIRVLHIFTVNNTVIEIPINIYGYIVMTDKLAEILNYNKSDLAD